MGENASDAGLAERVRCLEAAVAQATPAFDAAQYRNISALQQ
jgi:hypothetical protein